ncbi:MAG: hypothetical protein NZZ41_02455 [Candidatus Dojkabacteria bacterium]|nr:hypothetical protein [Candidatus Dojkabacteria bacterium]
MHDNNSLKSEVLLSKLNQFIREKDILNLADRDIVDSDRDRDRDNMRYLLNALDSTRNILSALNMFIKSRRGVIGKIKSIIEKIVKNISLNLLETVLVRQNKFNDILYYAIVNLDKRIQDIENRVIELTKNTQNSSNK